MAPKLMYDALLKDIEKYAPECKEDFVVLASKRDKLRNKEKKGKGDDADHGAVKAAYDALSSKVTAGLKSYLPVTLHLTGGGGSPPG